ncbi:creatininase family protein [Saccharothrix obliqua]|uniref:creatininase family protein n=1 Tax=Saccharothrix obliqua TaxID=2861747 RepID=UPI001C6076D6|nr:creatininase family protein [Saccharothrix obliqua]MBW4722265.1 creatininase family protein [Saccharothrix obliqua]
MVLPSITSADAGELYATLAVLPVGSYEQHGDHLPLSTDTLIASLIAREVAGLYGLLPLPPITISCSHEHAAYPGTVSISASTLIRVIEDIRGSLQPQGVNQLVIVNGHGGNHVLSNIVQEANTDARRVALFPDRTTVETARMDAGMESSLHDDMHGGEWETSIMLRYFPEMVDPHYRDRDRAVSDRRHLLTVRVDGYAADGIIGFPSLASAAKGEAAVTSLVALFGGVYHVLQGFEA